MIIRSKYKKIDRKQFFMRKLVTHIDFLCLIAGFQRLFNAIDVKHMFSIYTFMNITSTIGIRQ